MKQLVIATHNPDKAREISALLVDQGVEVLTLDAYPQVGHIVEDAETLEGNALLKAQAVARATGLPSLGDDTGLEVGYLNGDPGVYSSRYSGEHATYADNVAKLTREMKGVPERRRAARFRCVLAFVAPGRDPVTVEGICRGTILEKPRGNGGFGYDPLFLPLGYRQTLAEMEMSVKNTLSHRGRAMQNMLPHLKEYYK
ncbi:MAG TPA: RdgB/HAM1 family non-canonical purine NTP pyrophosphatase [Bacteroidota bacterium]|nr:RdgB/HAM1 family non-canonical purine NTP pyrophosphatase [Bacteroidota bacterium]